MKLFELIDAVSKKTNTPSWARRKRYEDRLGLSRIGGGAYSSVYNLGLPHRQNDVMKITHDRSEDEIDAYEIYLLKVDELQKKGIYNPYFPKVSSHKTYRTPKEQIYSVSIIEKLYDFRTPKIFENEELLHSICSKMFVDLNFDLTPLQISSQIETAVDGHLSNIKDTNLSDACTVINQLIRSYDNVVINDISYNNIMWRMTGYIPQLVITDPLAG